MSTLMTISSTNTNGNVLLEANGTGKIIMRTILILVL